jgi:hypothetical protein
MTVRGADQVSIPVHDGDVAPLIDPPQGGRVIFAGVRATNIDPCGVVLTGSLRDLTTNAVRFDTRTLNLEPTDDGWGGSEDDQISSFANIPVCGNSWSPTNIYGTEYELEVALIDAEGHSTSVKARVVPGCVEPGDKETECLCICKGGYVLGECADAGTEGTSM